MAQLFYLYLMKNALALLTFTKLALRFTSRLPTKTELSDKHSQHLRLFFLLFVYSEFFMNRIAVLDLLSAVTSM